MSSTPRLGTLRHSSNGRGTVRLTVETLEQRDVPSTGSLFDFGRTVNFVADDYVGVRAQAFTVPLGYGWLPGRKIGIVDRGTSDPLTRDFVRGRDRSFQVVVPDGRYDVRFTLGDARPEAVRDRIELWVEGVQVASNLQSANGQFLTPTFQADVTDGMLTVRIRDTGGVTPCFALNALDISPAAGTTSPGYHFDFGRLKNYVPKGYVGVGRETDTIPSTFGWVSAEGLVVVQRNTSNLVTSDFVAGRDQTFQVAVPNGKYDVRFTLGDASAVRDRIDLWVEGTQVASGLRSWPGQFLTPVYRAEVADGILTVRICDGGGATPRFALAALDVMPAVEGSDPSPTGGTPRLLWTGEQQAVWNRMRAENHPWWQLIKDKADRTGTSNESYADFGQWATLAFQITGDQTYAQKAYAKIVAFMPGITDRNITREYFAEFDILYDWLRPALSPAQRSNLIGMLNHWADLTLNKVPGTSWGTRTGDSDELIGHYFGLALLDLATQGENPRAGTFLNATWVDVYEKPVGGLTPTGANHDSMRNAVKLFAQLAEGGEWLESSDYNLGTLKLLLMGVQAVKTATGQDYFPEMTRFIKQAALAEIRHFTPDLRASAQWGDEEHPRELSLYKRVPLLGMLAGLTQNDPDVGPYVNGLIAELVNRYGALGYGSAEPMSARIFFFYNPYAPQADWRQLAAGDFRSGMGMLSYHTGWQATDSMFVGHMPTRVGVDHEVAYFGDFQLYRNGEWAVTHPLGYSGPAVSAEATNSLIVAGLSSMYDRAPVAHEIGAGYAYQAGTTRGDYYPQPFWDPPPAFLNEWTRSQLYLPGEDGAADAIIILDRADLLDPRTLPKLDRYYDPDEQAIRNAPALLQWNIHMPEAPRATADGYTWNTAGGQTVQLFSLSEAAQTATVIDEDVLWGGMWNFYPSERQYQLRLSPVQEQEWNVLLNVVTAGGGTTAARVASAGGEAEGALVQRAGMADALALFGAVRGTRILSAGYTAQWTASAASTEVHLFDLNPAKSWSVQVDGGPPQALAVSDQGVAHVIVSGTGAHQIQLIAV